LPADELKYAALRHQIPLAPDWNMQVSGSYVTAAPGASLEPNHIQSDSMELGMGISYQPIRQWQENLIFSMEFSGKNTNGDILDNNPLTRDRIRVARAKLNYDTADGWNGYNYLSLALNQGLGVLGASQEGDVNLSRAEATPDFTSLNASYTRQQGIYSDWLAVGQLSAQAASAPLFSAEEFGYGGQGFGRAYDPSEITGDHGVAAALELRYVGLKNWREAQITPYAFYDIGKVWNEDRGSVPESAASVGLGARMSHSSGVSANLGLAWPLTRPAGTPLYGDGDSPRLLLQFGYGF
jgi:hemolysin activation/secretion protein